MVAHLDPTQRYDYDWNMIRAALDEECRAENLSGQMLAQEIGLTQSLYSMFMRGKRKTLGRHSVLKICQYFNVPHEHWLIKAPEPEAQGRSGKLEDLMARKDDLDKTQQGLLEILKAQIDSLHKELKKK